MTSGVALAWNVFPALRQLILISSDTMMLSQSGSALHFSHISLLLVSSVDHREEDLLSDRRLTQHPGGVDQGSAEHTQGPGQQPGRRGDRRQAHRERLAYKGQEAEVMVYQLKHVKTIVYAKLDNYLSLALRLRRLLWY